MEIEAVGLTVELVPAQFEPSETFVDRIERSLRVPFDVRIVDAENDDTALVAGIKPVEDECSSAPDMKVTCGRRRKADSYHAQNFKNTSGNLELPIIDVKRQALRLCHRKPSKAMREKQTSRIRPGMPISFL